LARWVLKVYRGSTTLAVVRILEEVGVVHRDSQGAATMLKLVIRDLVEMHRVPTTFLKGQQEAVILDAVVEVVVVVVVVAEVMLALVAEADLLDVVVDVVVVASEQFIQ